MKSFHAITLAAGLAVLAGTAAADDHAHHMGAHEGAVGNYQTPLVSSARVIDLRRALITPRIDDHGYLIIEDGLSEISKANRAELGAGDDAPHTILIRVKDGIFAIDPFEPMLAVDDLPGEESLAITRQVFGKFSLQTDRAFFGFQRVEAVSELFRTLERARIAWLKDNGYQDVRTFHNGGSRMVVDSGTAPQPLFRIRMPDDMPRGKSREQVQARPVLDGTARFSWPMGTPTKVIARTAAEVETNESTEIAHREDTDTERPTP